jgi:hypothetical protein
MKKMRAGKEEKQGSPAQLSKEKCLAIS